MWDSFVNAVSAGASAVTAGIVGNGEKVPFSCQVPFKKFEESMSAAEPFVQMFYQEALALTDSPKWQVMETTDPDGGDMKCWTQDQIGTYHLIKASFTIKNCKTAEVIARVTSERKAVRAEFSADLIELELLAEKAGCQLLRIAYSAPPPSVARDFCFLTGLRTSDDAKRTEAWGCSIDIPSRPEEYEGHVRAACLYMWRVDQVGEDTLCTYVTCFDPRGWAPPFLIAFFKGSATKEFCALRALCSNHGVKKVMATA